MGACANLRKFKEAKCKVLHLDQGNPRINTAWVEKRSRLALGRDFRMFVDQKAQHELSMYTCSPEANSEQPYPFCDSVIIKMPSNHSSFHDFSRTHHKEDFTNDNLTVCKRHVIAPEEREVFLQAPRNIYKSTASTD